MQGACGVATVSSTRSNTRIQPVTVAAQVSGRPVSTLRSRSHTVHPGSASSTRQPELPSAYCSAEMPTNRSASTPVAPVAATAWCCAAWAAGGSDERPRSHSASSRPAA